MAVSHGCVVQVRAWGSVFAGCLAIGCTGASVPDEAADTGTPDDAVDHSSSDSSSDSSSGRDGVDAGEADSSSESGPAGCGTECLPGTVQWEATWGTPGVSDAAVDIDVGASGRIAVVGSANAAVSSVPTDGFVAVHEPDGARVFEATLAERSRGVAVDTDDSIVVDGEDDAEAQWLRRYDDAGAIVWNAIDTVGPSVRGGPIVLAPNGDLVTGGGSADFGWIWRNDSDGNRIAAVPTPVSVKVQALALVGDDDILALGSNATLGSFWIGRRGGAGNYAWQTMDQGWAHAFALVPDGTIVAAITDPTGLSVLRHYSPDGELQSTSTAPRAGATIADLVVLDDGGLAVAGHVNDVGHHAWAARLDVHLAPVWELSYVGEDAPSELVAIDRAPDGAFVVAGSQSFADGSTDAWMLRIAP